MDSEKAPHCEAATLDPQAALDGSMSEAGTESAMTEDRALALLERRDLSSDVIEQVSRNSGPMKSRKVRLAVASHPRAPRHLSLRLIREFYTFDLMKFALLPAVAADLRRTADQLLVARIASVTLGERIALARRASETVTAALLLDKETGVWQAALENPRLTEVSVVKAALGRKATAALIEAVCRHPRWSPRHEVRMALLRNPHTPLARALEFARTFSPAQLRDILHSSHLPARLKAYLRKSLEQKNPAT